MTLHYPQGERYLLHEEAGIVDLLTAPGLVEVTLVLVSGQVLQGAPKSVSRFGLVELEWVNKFGTSWIPLSKIAAVEVKA